MKVSEVNISFIKPINGQIGFASIVINDELYLSSIAVHQKLHRPGEYRITYPTKLVGSQFQQIFHPINKQAALAIEHAILTKLKDVMNHDRYYRYTDTIA